MSQWRLTFIVQWIIITLQLMRFLSNAYIPYNWTSDVARVAMTIAGFVTEIPVGTMFTTYIISTAVCCSVIGLAAFAALTHHYYGWVVPLKMMRAALMWFPVVYMPLMIPHLKILLPCLSFTPSSNTINPFYDHLTCWNSEFIGFFILSMFIAVCTFTIQYLNTVFFYNTAMPRPMTLTGNPLNAKYTAATDEGLFLSKTLLLILHIAGHTSNWRYAMGFLTFLAGVATSIHLLWLFPYWQDLAMWLHLFQAFILAWTGVVAVLMTAFDDTEGSGMLYFVMLPVLLIASEMMLQWRMRICGDINERELTSAALVFCKIRFGCRAYFRWLATLGDIYIEPSEAHDRELMNSLTLTKHMLEIGEARFPDSADLHLYIADFYLSVGQNRVLAYRSLTNAENVSYLSADNRFRCQILRATLDEASAHDQSEEVRNYTEFKNRRVVRVQIPTFILEDHMNMRELAFFSISMSYCLKSIWFSTLQIADRAVSQAMRTLIEFWTEVMNVRPDIDKLATTGERARTYLSTAIAQFERMLEINPQNVYISRLYGVICLEILGDVSRAQELFAQATTLINNKSKMLVEYNYGDFLRELSLNLDIFDESNALVSVSINTETMGIVESVNPAFIRMMGMKSSSDIVGKSINAILADPIRQHHDQYMTRYLAGSRQSTVISHTRMVMAVNTHGTLLPLAMFVRFQDEALGKLIAVMQPLASAHETCAFINPNTLMVTAATSNLASIFGFSRRDVLARKIKLPDIMPGLSDDATGKALNDDIYKQLVRMISHMSTSMKLRMCVTKPFFLIFSLFLSLSSSPPVAAIKLSTNTTSPSRSSPCTVSSRWSPCSRTRSTSSAVKSRRSPAKTANTSSPTLRVKRR